MKMRWLSVAGVMLMAGAVFAADKVDTNAPKAVIEKVTKDAIAVLREKEPTAEQKREKIRVIADDSMDAEVMCRLSLGKNWKPLPDDKKKEFVTEFKKYVANTFSHTLDSYTDEDVSVIGTKSESGGDVTVNTSIIGTKDSGARGEVAKVDYRLRKHGDAWKVIDLNIDGVSLLANFRSQFQDIISNGNADQLLKTLKDKNEAAAKDAGKK